MKLLSIFFLLKEFMVSISKESITVLSIKTTISTVSATEISKEI